MIREYSNTVEEKLLQLERRLDKQREEHEKEIDALLLALEALWQENKILKATATARTSQ